MRLDQPRVGRVPAEESADPAHARYARLRGRVVPRRTAARRRGLGAVPRACSRRRPGGFPIASLMRPPADGRGRGALRRARPRGGGARPVRAPHALDVADRTRARPAASPASAVLREGRWLREQGLEPRFFCGGGWYTDADVMAAVAELGYADCTATAWRPAYLPPGAPRAALDAAGVGPARRRPPRARAADDALARRGGARARAARCRRVVHVHFHDYELLDAQAAARRSRSTLAAARAAAARRSSSDELDADREVRVGATYAPTDRRSPRSRAALAAAARARLSSARALGPRRQGARSASRVLRDGKAVVAAGQGRAPPLPARARRGEQHTLTKVDLVEPGGVYQVATDEPGRTATVHGHARRRAAAASRVRAAPGDRTCSRSTTRSSTAPGRALPRRRRARRRPSTCAAQILPVKVADRCSYAPVPFFASSAGWGVRLATPERRRRSRSRARPAAPAASSATSRRARFPPLDDRAEVCVQGARLDERHLRRRRSRRRSRRTRRDTGKPRVPPPSELELIKWRDVDDGPGAGARGHRAAAGGGDPDRLGAASTTRGRRCDGTLTFDRHRFPDPAGLIRAGPRARRHASCSGSRRRSTCADRLPPRRAARRPAEPARARPARAGRRRRVPARGSRRSPRSGSTASRPTAATRSTSRRSTPTLQNDYPLLFAQRGAWARCRRDAAAIFRAGHDRLAARRCPGSGRATSRGDLDRPAARDRAPAQTAGDERLPDLGLGRRRLPLGRR